MKRVTMAVVLLAAVLNGAAAAQEMVEYWCRGGESALVLGIKTDPTGQYLVNVNEAWVPADPKTFAAEDENGYTAVIAALRPPFRAKLKYRKTGDEVRVTTIIEIKVIEQYATNGCGDIVRPGHSIPIVSEEQDNPDLVRALREKERAR